VRQTLCAGVQLAGEEQVRELICLGYWRPTLALTHGVANLRPLLEEEPTKGAAWYPDRWFRSKHVVSNGNGNKSTVTPIEGTLRSNDCKRYCVGGDGRRATDGMCDVCRRLPSENNFHTMLTRRVTAAARTDLLTRAGAMDMERM
jgi:hypothetical protein